MQIRARSCSDLPPGAARSRSQHQLAALAAAGVRVALCTDNPAVSGTRLTREYELARDLVDATTLDLIRHNAIAARFTLGLGLLGNVRTTTMKAFPEAAYREIIASLG